MTSGIGINKYEIESITYISVRNYYNLSYSRIHVIDEQEKEIINQSLHFIQTSGFADTVQISNHQRLQALFESLAQTLPFPHTAGFFNKQALPPLPYISVTIETVAWAGTCASPTSLLGDTQNR